MKIANNLEMTDDKKKLIYSMLLNIQENVNNVVKLCDMHNIPLATNLATAELLIKSLDRGDLEWREMYK